MMCMPRIFGVKITDGKKEVKKSKNIKKKSKKTVHQSHVEFE